jgi:hypothetical protein
LVNYSVTDSRLFAGARHQRYFVLQIIDHRSILTNGFLWLTGPFPNPLAVQQIIFGSIVIFFGIGKSTKN